MPMGVPLLPPLSEVAINAAWNRGDAIFWECFDDIMETQYFSYLSPHSAFMDTPAVIAAWK